VFENRVPRRVFGPKRDEVTGRWRKLHVEGCHLFYSSPSIIRMIKSRRMGLARYVARNGRREIRKVFVKEPEGKRPLGRSRLRWMDNIKMNFREIEWGGVDGVNSHSHSLFIP
jgi:hypothetical protein